MAEDKGLLADSFNESINRPYTNVLQTICDSPLIDLIDLTSFEGVPLLRCVISLFRIGGNIKEAFYLKKLSSFLLGVGTRIDAGKIEKHKEALIKDKRKREKEIEYVMVILDRYLELEKSELVSRLYIAFLANEIDWDTFASFASSIDRLIIKDIEVLVKDSFWVINETSDNFDSASRLESCGLIYLESEKMRLNDDFEIVPDSFGRARFRKTLYGSKLVNCLEKYK